LFIHGSVELNQASAIISEICSRDGKSGINVYERLFLVMELLNIAFLSRRRFHLIYECILS